MKKRIIVTGGNRGIGREVCKQLVDLGHDVTLTARSPEKGHEAAKEVGAHFMQLDVSNKESIYQFTAKFNKEVGALDVLINNAAILKDNGMDVINADLDVVQQTIQTNVYGPWRLIQELSSLLQKSDNGRIINISSGMGAIEDLRGDHPAYRISKAALNALTIMAHSQVGSSVKVNAMCPGWVRTDMGGSGAHRPVEKGAETAVWLATEEEIPGGKFFRDKKEIQW
ncbi:Short-chain dehydrogenase involved in D-alanine esterification of teichoic acids [Ekhidna lutea]|uniref:Short-chain dehydrogenase involved in D-alanine esterification of teichoic acids n=1 Tax=Ekhidna lutea TaxID=447679 RepID=A0A239EK93_EKHLU|nr:SDR family NAD(P)-dependent oxidoreductase [Ekhidna lutea]SNS45075.1 Short-chain dehydrogenase involved in D-alanine esterification of teichoic acids [Ekhidna lutea]